MYSPLLVLVVLMAGGGRGSKRQRTTTKQQEEPPVEDVGSEYAPDDESETESTDWEGITPEIQSAKAKGKEKVVEKETEKSKGKGKEKLTTVRSKKKTGGIEIREPAEEVPRRSTQGGGIDSKRRTMYSSKHCIGERHVAVQSLMNRVPGLQVLFENGGLYAISDFPEQTGYCLELVREFYMRAGYLEDSDGETFSFKTSVRGVEMTITPATIASVLGMQARTTGVEYLHAGFDAVRDWRMVMNGVCMPNAEPNGILVMSKELKIEYRFLNFVVCYNIMPLANTKVVRWDRMLYMYLVGKPDVVNARNINLNVPFLVWRRMAKDIKTSNQSERLPFPLIIMRLLKMFKVNTKCSSYEHSLGVINETTFIKSSVQLEQQRTPPRRSSQQRSTPPPGPSRPSVEVSEDEMSVSSVYREQQRLSQEQERISGELRRLSEDQARMVAEQARLTQQMGKLRRLMKAIFDKLGCCSADIPPAGGDSD